jgi:hypothetical protein
LLCFVQLERRSSPTVTRKLSMSLFSCAASALFTVGLVEYFVVGFVRKPHIYGNGLSFALNVS